jgi:hypothetical protein
MTSVDPAKLSLTDVNANMSYPSPPVSVSPPALPIRVSLPLPPSNSTQGGHSRNHHGQAIRRHKTVAVTQLG